MQRWTVDFKRVACFLLGFGTFLHEVALTSGDRPYIITGALALMGFPFVLGLDAKLTKKGGDSS